MGWDDVDPNTGVPYGQPAPPAPIPPLQRAYERPPPLYEFGSADPNTGVPYAPSPAPDLLTGSERAFPQIPTTYDTGREGIRGIAAQQENLPQPTAMSRADVPSEGAWSGGRRIADSSGRLLPGGGTPGEMPAEGGSMAQGAAGSMFLQPGNMPRFQPTQEGSRFFGGASTTPTAPTFEQEQLSRAESAAREWQTHADRFAAQGNPGGVQRAQAMADAALDRYLKLKGSLTAPTPREEFAGKMGEAALERTSKEAIGQMAPLSHYLGTMLESASREEVAKIGATKERRIAELTNRVQNNPEAWKFMTEMAKQFVTFRGAYDVKTPEGKAKAQEMADSFLSAMRVYGNAIQKQGSAGTQEPQAPQQFRSLLEQKLARTGETPKKGDRFRGPDNKVYIY